MNREKATELETIAAGNCGVLPMDRLEWYRFWGFAAKRLFRVAGTETAMKYKHVLTERGVDFLRQCRGEPTRGGMEVMITPAFTIKPTKAGEW